MFIRDSKNVVFNINTARLSTLQDRHPNLHAIRVHDFSETVPNWLYKRYSATRATAFDRSLLLAAFLCNYRIFQIQQREAASLLRHSVTLQLYFTGLVIIKSKFLLNYEMHWRCKFVMSPVSVA